MYEKLIFLLFSGVGGHGGSGIHADLKEKYSEIVQRVSLYAKPDLSPCVDTTTIISSEPKKSGLYLMSDVLPGLRTSVSSLSEVDVQRHSDHLESAVLLSRYPEISETVPENTSHNNNNNSNTGSMQTRSQNTRHSVPQTNVRQCTVCCIL